MVWKGLGYCLGGAVLSSTGWFLNDDADKLDSVPRISQLKDLGAFLFRNLSLFDFHSAVTQNHGSGTVVAISGEVGSETPIDCELGGLQGVIVRKTEVKLLNWPESVSANKTSKEVPWYLDDGTCRVNVVGAQEAFNFSLPVENRAADKRLDALFSIFKVLGDQVNECVLPVGTCLSVVGEVTKDDNGALQIHKPKEGQFYVSTSTIDEIIDDYRTWARVLYAASVGLAVYYVFLRKD